MVTGGYKPLPYTCIATNRELSTEGRPSWPPAEVGGGNGDGRVQAPPLHRHSDESRAEHPGGLHLETVNTCGQMQPE